MFNKIFLFFFLSMMALAFTACHFMQMNDNNVQNTRILAVPTNTIIPNEKSDQEINRGEILVIEYYTLIGHGLYGDAYHLINSMSPQKPGFDQYSESVSVIYHKLDLLTVEPYAKWAKRNGLRELPIPDDVQYFYIELQTWSISEMSTDSANSVEQHIFVKLKKEGAEWTIYSFATNPPIREN